MPAHFTHPHTQHAQEEEQRQGKQRSTRGRKKSADDDADMQLPSDEEDLSEDEEDEEASQDDRWGLSGGMGMLLNLGVGCLEALLGTANCSFLALTLTALQHAQQTSTLHCPAPAPAHPPTHPPTQTPAPHNRASDEDDEDADLDGLDRDDEDLEAGGLEGGVGGKAGARAEVYEDATGYEVREGCAKQQALSQTT